MLTVWTDGKQTPAVSVRKGQRMAKPPKPLPQSVIDQVRELRLPTGGACPFDPAFRRSPSGVDLIRRGAIDHGPKRDKAGFRDKQGRIWIRDRAHGGVPEHWNVQIDGGRRSDRVGDDGNSLA